MKKRVRKKPYRIIEIIKRNPIMSTAALIGILAGIQGAVAGYNFGMSIIEPVAPAFHYWVRDHVDGIIKPIVQVQATQAVTIDRFLLYRQQEDLRNLMADPAWAQSPNLKKNQIELEEQIKETQERICKATGKKCP